MRHSTSNQHSRSRNENRLMVISLDGFPWSLLPSRLVKSRMPYLTSLLSKSPARQTESVHPTVSSVAWASYMTGCNPGRHGIYGFIDRTLPAFDLTIPTANNLCEPAIWKILSHHQIPVLIMNVPMTYPPEPVHGALIGCFLGTDIRKLAFPDWVNGLLAETGYIIDADVSPAMRSDPEHFIHHLNDILTRRVETFHRLSNRIAWKFSHIHLMETDRLFHFYFKSIESETNPDHVHMHPFFAHLDDCIRALAETLRPDDELILMSDHGFCASTHEVQLNSLLEKGGFLQWQSSASGDLSNLHPDSRAYSLIPGRIYLNLKDREPNGTVSSVERIPVLREICDFLSQVRLNGSGQPVLERILRRDEIYHGPQTIYAPDLVAVPAHGFELKSKLIPSEIFSAAKMSGTHTFHDAMACSRRGRWTSDKPKIIDFYSGLLDFFNLSSAACDGGKALIYD